MSKTLNAYTAKGISDQTHSDFSTLTASLKEILESKKDEELASVLALCRSVVNESSDEMLGNYLDKYYKSIISPDYLIDLMPHNLAQKYGATFISDDSEALEDDWKAVGDEIWAAWAAHIN